MISHKYKCIFIHISKCAGTSIEEAFGVDSDKWDQPSYENLYGWCPKEKLFLQHATPQQLLDKNYISKEQWETYYKFIVVRNPYDRAFSDYNWVKKNLGIKRAGFSSFIYAKGKFYNCLNVKNLDYRGDHLYTQKSYFILNDGLIEYDKVLRFESLNEDLSELIKDLGVEKTFFSAKHNVNDDKKKKHYSHFYNFARKNILERKYKEDIAFLNYSFEDKRTFFEKIF